MRLRVGGRELHVVEPGPLAVLTPCGDEALGAIDAEHAAFRSDHPRELDARLPEAAPDVQHALTFARGMRRKGSVAVLGRSRDEDLAEAFELGNEDLVPHRDGL